MGARLPVYYCPPTVLRPDHIRAEAPNQLLAGMGPDHLGGITFGDIIRPDQAWHQTSAGWWVCLDGVTPRDLLRVSALPGIVVHDAEARAWLVPRLIGLDGAAAVGFFTPTGFAVPAPLAPIVEALRLMLDYTGPITAEHAQLAASVLGINYYVSLHELGVWQAFTPGVVLQVLLAACSMTADQALRARPEGLSLGPA